MRYIHDLCKFASILLICCYGVSPCMARTSAKTGKKSTSSTHSSTQVPNTVESPDFAFPLTVIDNAQALIRSASKRGDEPQVIKGAVQIIVANSAIDTERLPAMLTFLDSVSTTLSAQGQCIISSLQAQLLTYAYQRNRYTYDHRTLPPEPLPADPQLWSTQMFAARTLQLVKSSLSPALQLQQTPSTQWSDILADATNSDLVFYPTLYSILARRGLDMLESYTGGASPIPFGTTEAQASIAQLCSNEYLDIAKAWYSSAAERADVAEVAVSLPYLLKRTDSQEQFTRYLHEAESYQSSPYSIELLISAGRVMYAAELSRQEQEAFYSMCDNAISTYPDYVRTPALKEFMARAERDHCRLQMQSIFTPTQPVTATISDAKLPPVSYLSLYSVPTSAQDSYKLFKAGSLKCVASQLISTSDTDSITCSFGQMPAGRYLAVITGKDGKLGELSSDYMECKVTNFALDMISDYQSDTSYVQVLSPADGQPHSGVEVVFSTRQGKEVKRSSAHTDKYGLARIPSELGTQRSIEATVQKGSDRVTLSEWIASRSRSDRQAYASALLLTDLGLYHPGDTCRFTAIAYLCDERARQYKAAPEKSLTAVLYTPGYEGCDTISLCTDHTGRASAEIPLPSDGINGRYRISIYEGNPFSAASTGKYVNSIGDTFVQVEQYQRPTFYAETEDIPTLSTTQPLQISGIVKTFAGMPVADAQVVITISEIPSWWRMAGGTDSYTTQATTDAEGRYHIELSTDRLQGTKYENNYYKVEVLITAPSGESQSAPSRSFYLGSKAYISYIGSHTLQADTDNIEFAFDVKGMTPEHATYRYTISSISGTFTLSGECSAPTISVAAKDIPSGTYTIHIAGADTECEATVTIFRTSDTTPATSTALWAPITDITLPQGAKHTEIPVGSSYDNSIFYMVSGSQGIIDKGFISPQGAITHLSASAPQGRYERVWVRLLSYHEGEMYEQTVILTPAEATQQVNVERISFRNKIDAGAPERWSFRYTLGSEPLSRMPVVATLTDLSLSSIIPFVWSRPSQPSPYCAASLSNRYYNYLSNNTIYAPIKTTYKYPSLPTTDIQTYGMQPFGFNRQIHIRGRAMNGALMAKSESAYEDALVVEDAVSVMGAAMPEAKAMKQSTTDGIDTGAGTSVEYGTEQTDNFRPSELPVAWYKPHLLTDADGVLEISFDAPDFNTTWQLQMLGYTPQMLSALTTEEIVASKPVMVSATTPRFLRSGDKATLVATVYNNSDAVITTTAEMLLLEPISGREIAAISRQLTIQPGASELISISCDIPADIESLILRSSATIPGHRDREQALIAILPAQTSVIDSYPFYLGLDTDTYSVVLPHFEDDSQVALYYCNNPVWECLTALPTLAYDSDASILSAARALYAGATSAYLIKRYPQLSAAITHWHDTDSEMLTSQLSRSEQLKMFPCSQTPWALNASAQTSRMASLYQLTDTQLCDSLIAAAVERLQEAQHDGGWAWCQGMEPSLYISTRVLSTLALLHGYGYLEQSAQAGKMIQSAVKYCDTALYTDYIKQSRKYSLTQMLHYLYTRSSLGTLPMSADFLKLKQQALSEIEHKWRSMDIYEQATAAILLHREGSPMAARTILQSLHQHASSSQSMGMWYANLQGRSYTTPLLSTARVLEAYALIEPQSTDIDAMRQWLILQRQAQEWGEDEQLSQVVYAVLTSGSDWISSQAAPHIYIDDKEVEVSAIDSISGSFTMPLEASDASGRKLTIETPGSHPAWGSVIASYIAPLSAVHALSTPDISIEKRLLLVCDDTSGAQVSEYHGEPLQAGQRLRIQLTIDASRAVDYVVVKDSRSATLSPTDQLSGYRWGPQTAYYKEVRRADTLYFIPHLKAGITILEYDATAMMAGQYSVGEASLQSLYAPQIAAHTAAMQVSVNE